MKIVVTLTLTSALFSTAIKKLGTTNIVACRPSLVDDTVTFVAIVDSEQIVDTKLVGLDDATIDAVVEVSDNGGIEVTGFDATKNTYIATLERRNGVYGVVAEQKFATSPAYTVIMEQIASKQAPAFDTISAHTAGERRTWLGMTGKMPKTALYDNKEIYAARFDILGLVLTTESENDLILLAYAEFRTWFVTDENTNIRPEDAEPIYTTESPVRSLSHVNGSNIVLNLNDGSKVILDLGPLCDRQDAKLLGKMDDDHDTVFVGSRAETPDVATFVDFARGTTRFVPTSQLTGSLAQYAA